MARTLFDSSGRPLSSAENPRRRLSRNQLFVLVGTAVTLIGILISNGVAVWQTRVSRVAYSGPWLRFEYFVCTGPYNNYASTFEQLPVHARGMTTTSADFERAPRDFIIKNDLFRHIQALEPEGDRSSDRGSQVASVVLNEQDLDALTGYEETSDVRRWTSVNGTRDPEEKKRKVAHYFQFLTVNRPTVKMMGGVSRVPPWVRVLARNEPAYDEPVDMALGGSPHNDALYADVYFRSVRTVHVRIQNISPYVLTNLQLDLLTAGTGSRLALSRPGDAAVSNPARFPLEILRPGEAVVFPLSISLVPHLEATSMGPDGAEFIKENWSEDKLDGLRGTILSSVGQQTIALQPLSELKRVTFQIEDESTVLEEVRGIATKDRLMINNNCECGSCPLVFMRGRNRHWLRAMEFLSFANGPGRAEDFELLIPAGVSELLLAENPGETAYLRDIRIVAMSTDGKRAVHRVKAGPSVISVGSPLKIDLQPYLGPGVRLRLAGHGYYVKHAETVCPFVFPLPGRWLTAMATKGGS